MKRKASANYIISFLTILIVLFFFMRLEAEENNINQIGVLQVIDRCLEANFNIQQQKLQVKIVDGRLQQLYGDFDYSINSFISFDHKAKSIFNSITDITTIGVGLNKQFANGMNLSANINDQKTINPDNPQPVNFSTIDFAIAIPLLKNAGRNSVYANVTAAKLNLKEEKFTLQDQICQSIKQVLIAYWEYVAGNLVLEERKKAEQRAKSLVDDTNELIRLEEVAPSEIIQYQGNLGNKISARLAQEQSVYEIKLNLGKLLGLSIDESINLPVPADNFPNIKNVHVKQGAEIVANILNESQKNRSDYLAVVNEKAAAMVLYEAAKKNVKPDLNLTLNVGYNGYKPGNDMSSFFDSLITNIPGFNVNMGIKYVWVLANNVSEGHFKQQYFNMQQIINKEKELLANIKKDIMTNYMQIIRLIQQFSFTWESTKNFALAFENEKIKYKMNMSTQINIIETEDRFIEAAISEIIIKKQLSIAILNLLYCMGELGHFEDDKFIVDKAKLIDLPSIIVE